MRKTIKIIGLMGLILSLRGENGLAQSEKIVSFHSDITIHADASMTVHETTEVICDGQEIKRGIFRTFPTRYKDRFGNKIKVLFRVQEVLKDGRPEPYHTEAMSNGVKVYVGQKDVYLDPGNYVYTLVYQTDRQIGFFEDFDELYWNVTGLDWNFTIDRADAVVHLPEGAEILGTAAYTGPAGSQGQDFAMQKTSPRDVRFRTTRSLYPFEGLTIAVSFNKGILSPPTFMKKTGFMIQDNPSSMVTLAGLGLLLFYYFMAWSKVGVDPPKGTIFPRFTPPDRYSPAATRFVMKMGYSNRVFAAAIVNMAVKGVVTIHEKKGKFSLNKTNTDVSVLSKCEQSIANKLFGTKNTIEFEQKNHLKIQEAIQAQNKCLKMEFEKMHFRTNRIYLIPGYGITILTVIAVLIFSPVGAGAGFMAVWLSGWTTGCFFLTKGALSAWRSALAKGVKGAGPALGVTLFALPFLLGEIGGLWAFSTLATPLTTFLLLIIFLVNVLFYQLIKAPTILGRRVMDRIEGFKMYLEVAEKEWLKILHPPEKTPELFEKYLPYALALGVENAWSEKFTGVLAGAAENRDYSPSWYSGRDWSSIGAIGLASSLGSSFSSAISSSSTAPGSSSGSGGGGSSGGGGGGGGGGGW